MKMKFHCLPGLALMNCYILVIWLIQSFNASQIFWLILKISIWSSIKFASFREVPLPVQSASRQEQMPSGMQCKSAGIIRAILPGQCSVSNIILHINNIIVWQSNIQTGLNESQCSVHITTNSFIHEWLIRYAMQ